MELSLDFYICEQVTREIARDRDHEVWKLGDKHDVQAHLLLRLLFEQRL